MVMRSPISCVGWLNSDMPLMTAQQSLGEADDVLVTVNASHHDIEQRAHNASGVARGTRDRRAGWCRAIELSMAAEVGHSSLEGKTGAGGDLLEDHAKALVTEQVRIITVNLDGLLHCGPRSSIAGSALW